jgi:hypothetical protein
MTDRDGMEKRKTRRCRSPISAASMGAWEAIRGGRRWAQRPRKMRERGGRRRFHTCSRNPDEHEESEAEAEEAEEEEEEALESLSLSLHPPSTTSSL